LKFYKNVSFNKNKELKPEMPCDFSHNNEIWFYLPKDIIPLTNIINFENIKISKLVTTKNSKGIVVSIKKNNNKNFYSKNSSVSKIITLLTTSLNYVNLMPDKKFKIID
jgi:RNase H-fold protein (predicted Holliday junction resolvase)